MKSNLKEVLLFTAIGMFLLGMGYVLGVSEPCTKKHQNFIDDGRIVIIPVGEVEGRKKFNVLFNDEDGIDDMYPEEIASGLITGKWDYNEMLTIKEEQ
jgi:hypothetical protein